MRFAHAQVAEIEVHRAALDVLRVRLERIENLGDNFVAGIRGEPVNPGETSETISLQSFQGVEGQNLAHFKDNPAWKTAVVKLFVKSKGSQYVLVGEYKVSRKINFTEPEPVGQKPQPKEKK